MTRFAAQTEVSTAKSEADIKATLRRYKADAIATMESTDKIVIAFQMNKRNIVMKLPLPDRNDQRFTHGRVNQHSAMVPRSPDAAYRAWEQACRSKWRALLLCIKAKLESVESGIETFDDAFLPHIQLANGETVGEHLRGSGQLALEQGRFKPLQITHQ